jgi:CHAT domain-containing protein
LLHQQGLVETAHKMLVELLCEWPDALSKTQILQFLVINRSQADDHESAVWFQEKFQNVLGIRSDGTGVQNRGVDLVTSLRMSELYFRADDLVRAKERMVRIESWLLAGDGTRVVDSSPALFLHIAAQYVRLGDMVAAEKAVTRWEALKQGGIARARQADDANEVAQLSYAYLEAGHRREAQTMAQKALDGSANARPEVRRAVEEVAFGVLAQISIAASDGPGALEYLRRRGEAQRAREASIQTAFPKPGTVGLFDALFAEWARGITQAVVYTEQVHNAWLYGEAHRVSGQSDAAMRKYLEAVEVVEHLRGFVGPADRLRYFAQKTGPYYSLVNELVSVKGKPAEDVWARLHQRGQSPAEAAFYFAEAARGRLLSERIAALRAIGAESALPRDLAVRESDLAERARAELLTGVPFKNSQALAEFSRLVDDMRKSHPDYTELKYPIPVTARQVPIRDNEVVLAYSFLEHQVAVWRLRQGGDVRLFLTPVPRVRVREAIRALRNSLEPDEGRLSAFNLRASSDLYEWLLAEPLRQIPRESRIVVIPDNELGTIPFEVLGRRSVDRRVEFAGQQRSFMYAPSATVLTYQRAQGKVKDARESEGQMLAVGDPVYDERDPRAKGGVSSGVDVADMRRASMRSYSVERKLSAFDRLPWTAEEVRRATAALATRGRAAELRMGYQASESEVKRHDLQKYRYIHFATHGILAGDVPYLQQPALVLTQVGDLEGEDGFLTLEEVLKLKLQADLTTLSACQTGLGEAVSGEGVVGLARAFLYAGSRSVLVSLWKVDDESTAMLMGRFYGYVGTGMPLADALARAKRELQAEPSGRWAHPFHWASFVLFGSE